MRYYKILAVLIILILILISCSEEKSVNENKHSEKEKTATAQAKAYFAGGCFWGVEYLFEQKEGVISAVSGYMGGSMEKPSYRDVLSGNTGHLEAVEVTYDPAKVNYEALAKYFFEIHDPTQAGGQGPDIGEQYISAVFYENEEEKKIIQKLIDILKTKGYRVVTQVRPAGTFWKAEEYHQNYYDKNRKQPYCHAYKKKF
jgi:peptide methionine sulfoxide reductase msrA/msrB